MKPLKLIDYSLVVISMMYSSYVTFWYLKEYIQLFFVAIVVAVFLVFLAHHYTYQAIQFFKSNQSINQYGVLALVLSALIFYAEWNGQLSHASSRIGISTTEKIDTQIEEMQTTLQESSKHTIKGKTNWATYQTFKDAQKNLEKLEKKRVLLLENIKLQKAEAEATANSFRAFSVLLYIMAFLATSVKYDEDAHYELKNIVDKKTQKVIHLIKAGEVNSAQVLIDYFNFPKEEAKFLYNKHAPQQIGF